MNTNELRELESFLAEKVMGWIYECEKPCRDGVLPFAFWNCGSTTVLVEQWKPTTDPAAAMQVLEKCLNVVKRPNAWFCGIEITIQNRGGRFNICQSSAGFYTIETEADTLPLAICQFAKQLFTH